MIAAFGDLLDRFDADPWGTLEEIGSAPVVYNLLQEGEEAIGRHCGLAHGGEAQSDVLIYLAGEEVSDHGSMALNITGTLIRAVCHADLGELTDEANAVCAEH